MKAPPSSSAPTTHSCAAESHARLPAGVEVERDGPLLRYLGDAGHGFVDYRDLGSLEGAALDALIARQVRVFAARGEPFEWKRAAHDRPSDLDRRLQAAAARVPLAH